MSNKKVYKDTYFFNQENALEVAKQQNRSGMFNDLQICYYNPLDIPLQESYENLIPLPLEKIYDYMVETPNRMIKDINLSSDLPSDLCQDIAKYITKSQKNAVQKKYDFGLEYKNAIKNAFLDFDEPWRIFFLTSRHTTVLQYVIENIAEAFNGLGYDTFISKEQNDMQSWHIDNNNAWHLKDIYEYNPHIVINLDNLNETLYNVSTFNFTWFQDSTAILYNKTKIDLNVRDYIFTLHDEFRDALIQKGVDKSKLFRQSFATNPKIFFENKLIKKENKVVFLGSNYNFHDKCDISDNLVEEIIDDIKNNSVTKTKIQEYAVKSGLSKYTLEVWIIPSLVRKVSVIWMCQLENIDIEVYGTDSWLDVPEVAPYYKGLLSYGKEMAKVYNSAKYAIVAHSQYRYQQRLFEISACGAIPLVYKGQLLNEEFHHEENILSFNTLKELSLLIGKEPVKDSREISKDISYKNMAKKILDIVKNQLEEER